MFRLRDQRVIVEEHRFVTTRGCKFPSAQCEISASNTQIFVEKLANKKAERKKKKRKKKQDERKRKSFWEASRVILIYSYEIWGKKKDGR